MMCGIASRVPIIIVMFLLLAACGPNCPYDPAYRYDPKTGTCIDLGDDKDEVLIELMYQDYLDSKHDAEISEVLAEEARQDYLNSIANTNEWENSDSESENEIWYAVKRGDTLRKIGALYGVSAKDIAQANNLPNPDRIYVGQKLLIPSSSRSAPTSISTVRTVPPTAKPTTKPSVSTPRPPVASTPSPLPQCVEWTAARQYVNQQKCICGPVVNTYYATATNGQPTFLDIGARYPNLDRFSVVIWGRYRAKFGDAPERLYANRRVCVTGLVELYKSVPQIQAYSPNAFQMP